MNEDYRFFVQWADLTDDLQFSISGFYHQTVGQDLYEFGEYILVFKPDNTQPILSSARNLIQAIIKVKGNPTSDYLRLSTPDRVGNEYVVKLYDMNGRLIRSVDDWQHGDLKIPVYDQPNGTYVYQVCHKNKILTTGQFIKM